MHRPITDEPAGTEPARTATPCESARGLLTAAASAAQSTRPRDRQLESWLPGARPVKSHSGREPQVVLCRLANSDSQD